jgi:regulatory protein
VLAYVQRYAAPREQTRRRWAQRIARSVAEHGGEAAALHAALEAVLDLAERYRFVDDRAFAASRSRRALARGVAPARVRAQLSARGVAPEVASGAVADAGGPDAEVAAAAAYARRRLGAWRDPETRADHHQRDLAALARAGFGYAAARAALAGREPADGEG